MSNARLFILISVVLSGCAGPEGGLGPVAWSWPFVSTKLHAEPVGKSNVSGSNGGYSEFSFDWQLSGDPEVMPLQVFDDGVGMWLQFAPQGAWPAVFESTAGGQRPLSYRHEPPYMRLDGVYEHLELRGGHLRGSVRRANTETTLAQPAIVAEPAPLPMLPAALAEREPPLAAVAASHVDLSPVHTSGPASDPVVPGTAVLITDTDTVTHPGIEHYAVSPADLTMRQALERWARLASWTFSAEHWAVDVDIPLVGEASFESDFKSSVRELLAATEMGDRPLQPCFYSNRVLRVVPHAQACDRRGVTRAVS